MNNCQGKYHSSTKPCCSSLQTSVSSNLSSQKKATHVWPKQSNWICGSNWRTKQVRLRPQFSRRHCCTTSVLWLKSSLLIKNWRISRLMTCSSHGSCSTTRCTRLKANNSAISHRYSRSCVNWFQSLRTTLSLICLQSQLDVSRSSKYKTA